MSKLPFAGVLAGILLCVWGSTSGANSSGGKNGCAGTGHLSPPVHTAKYLQALTSGGLMPNWSQGRLSQVAGPSAPGTVDVYDREGQRLFQALIRFPGLSGVMVFEAAPLASGLLASGHAYKEQLLVNFIAKTDDSGTVAELIPTGQFMASRMCGQSDDTIWAFGRDLTKERENQSYFMLRQYSSEGTLLHGYLSRDSVAINTHGVNFGGGRTGAYLDCGANVISLYLNQSDEFVQVNTTQEGVQRWHMDMTVLPEGKVNGLGLLSNGCAYASLHAEVYGKSDAWGLYVLQVEAGKEQGSWIPVTDTVHSRKWNEEPAPNSFWNLRGAEGDELVIKRYIYSGEFQWVRVY